MYRDSDVKTAYAKTKAQLMAELNDAGVGFMDDFKPNKDELVSAWLARFGMDRECPLCGKSMGNLIDMVHKECADYEHFLADRDEVTA